MSAIDTLEKRPETEQDQIGSLADSARRHLAYEALSEQVAISEAALHRILESIDKRGQQSAQNSFGTDGE